MKKYWGDGPTQFFYELTPDRVLDSLEELGHQTTGRCLFLNSMENRVVEVEVEEDSGERKSFVVKYYRPGRWSYDEIKDEHEFLLDLKEDEVGAIYPVEHDGETLFLLDEEDIYFALFPKMGGRHLEPELPDSLERFGSALARLHQAGRRRPAPHRQKLTTKTFGLDVMEGLLEGPYLPRSLHKEYERVVREICNISDQLINPLPIQRIHGDCHGGNVLFNQNIMFVDFDDMLNGPVIQDFWMVMAGDREEQQRRSDRVAEGYEIFGSFPYDQLKAIESLRSLRMIHYNGWIAKRFDDPSFKHHFSYFQDEGFWQNHLRDLYDQLDQLSSL
jgi:Ser/Thr protein kinase RdoA (MazF antagonist)